MTIQHLTPSDYITTKWSGGLTTQLGIAPAGAVYADRDFLWRLSSATVEDAESDFTALPDYERLISTLEGTIELNHNGGEKLTLNPYEVHRFDGGDDTHSWGESHLKRNEKGEAKASPFSVFKVVRVFVGLLAEAVERNEDGGCRGDDGQNADENGYAFFHSDSSCCDKVWNGLRFE